MTTNPTPAPVANAKHSPKPRGTKAPEAPGVYRGTVKGRPAVFLVQADVVEAAWFGPSPGAGMVLKRDAWDIIDGRFQPKVHGFPARCTIAQSSRAAIAKAEGRPC